jgi:hypothetical protein
MVGKRSKLGGSAIQYRGRHGLGRVLPCDRDLHGLRTVGPVVAQWAYRLYKDTSGGTTFPFFGGERAVAAAEEASAAGANRGVAATLQVGSRLITDWSTTARYWIGAPTFNHPDVQAALNSVPIWLQSDFHGYCAEIGCINQALYFGVNPSGGFIVPVLVRAMGNPYLGTWEPPCSTCRIILPVFGIGF